MNKVIFKKNRSDVQRGVQLLNGRVATVVPLDGGWLFRFDVPFDIHTGEVCDTENPEKDVLSLNTIIKMGLGKEVSCYDEYDINFRNYKMPKDINGLVEKVILRFRKKGFNVSKEAILHNLSAWGCCCKSGYRDEDNGYHLFTPCGGGLNPLSFRLSTLNESCKDWQITYTC